MVEISPKIFVCEAVEISAKMSEIFRLAVELIVKTLADLIAFFPISDC